TQRFVTLPDCDGPRLDLSLGRFRSSARLFRAGVKLKPDFVADAALRDEVIMAQVFEGQIIAPAGCERIAHLEESVRVGHNEQWSGEVVPVALYRCRHIVPTRIGQAVVVLSGIQAND